VPKLERILCTVDFSEFSKWACRHALSLAKHYGAKLFVLNVVELWRRPSVCFAPAEGCEQFCRRLFDDGQREFMEFVKTLAAKILSPTAC
jgi:nucleotide-binding universal stress UspA family protein